MLNNNVLSNSDFYTGAFPAEFGDALSGVFDLNMRKGNYEKWEYLAQIGFNGFEFGAEGHLRLSYCGTIEEIKWGVERIKWALDPDSPEEIYILLDAQFRGERKAEPLR